MKLKCYRTYEKEKKSIIDFNRSRRYTYEWYILPKSTLSRNRYNNCRTSRSIETIKQIVFLRVINFFSLSLSLDVFDRRDVFGIKISFKKKQKITEIHIVVLSPTFRVSRGYDNNDNIRTTTAATTTVNDDAGE